MGQYNAKGLYAAYDKNNKERDSLDYYATHPDEVYNILQSLCFPLEDNDIILEPCYGGGHMIEGILKYLNEKKFNHVKIIGTDIKDRGYQSTDSRVSTIVNKDMLQDNYLEGLPRVDYVIMNPPFTLIEPFVLKMYDIAEKGLLMFGRIQFLEGIHRYKMFLQDTPPSDVYIYVDRVKCYKNGDFSNQKDRIQCYCWYWWDKKNIKNTSQLHWIKRVS